MSGSPNRRVELQESTGTKRFLYDEQAYLAESDYSDVIHVVYTQEPTLYGNVISQYRKQGAIWVPSYYHQDALGSTRELTSASAEVTDTYLFNAWGEPIFITGTTPNPFQWIGNIGYYHDPDTGNVYIRARTYQPTIGRWLSTDPIPINVLLLNSFQYGLGVPTSITDPSGEIPPAIAALVTALAGIAACFTASGGVDLFLESKKGAGNAWVHCTVSCAMSRLCSAAVAEVAGMLKELGPNVYDDYLTDFQRQLADTLSDVRANQACITWETWIPIGGWIGHLCRESCRDCCTRVVGYNTNEY